MADDDTTEIDISEINMQEQDNNAKQEESAMYGSGAMTEQELKEKYPNRPHNKHKTLPFHELYLTLFNPLKENTKKPTGPPAARKKQGPHGPAKTPHEIRRSIVERFISRWRVEVGNDIYPAFRLIVPEKDRDRAMYGLKEMTLAKLLVKVMKIDKNSEDAYNLLHWKLPGFKASSTMAGDFAGRCFEVISKRPMRTAPGDMTIAEVNEWLDKLSVAQKEESQMPIMEHFYTNMNADELMWLIRMILRQMKVGATEKTIFEIWHPDADNLFNISSSLRRVCWELYDPDVRLEGDRRGINLMQCFQPQLAAFQMRSIELMVTRILADATESDHCFYVEEKLDGERMQLHMMEDSDSPGGMKFAFWSRKAKDYTYLYGSGFHDDNSALTRHLKDAFDEGVRNIILDGEMITWDPKEDVIVGFGTLKTAAISEQSNPYATGNRPLFRAFDCLYLNDKDLTRYTLEVRRKALEQSVNSVPRRLEIHKFEKKTQASEVESLLRDVVATAGEGLVLKNPRSMYRLNERNDDWIKVKPEYMTEFGEALDCVIIGGYYGSGKRGGNLSSFMCGLRNVPSKPGDHPQKHESFFKVGGGFSGDDYAQIRHITEGKWRKWDPNDPPSNIIELGGGDRQFERPDVWIYPEDSVVVAVKAASVGGTDQFKTHFTLRFPRFKKLRTDKNWKSALSKQEFLVLRAQVEEEQKEKQFKIDDERRQRTSRKRKRPLVIQGQDETAATAYAGPATKVFEGLTFLVLTEAMKPIKKSKVELEQLVKANGGTVSASDRDENTIIVADRNLVKVASQVKKDQRNLVRPSWLLDCVKQSEIDVSRPTLLLPYEPQHLFHIRTEDVNEGTFNGNVDEYGDSFAKDVTPEELQQLLQDMPAKLDDEHDPDDFMEQLEGHGNSMDPLPSCMFRGTKAFCDDVSVDTKRLFSFAGGEVVERLEDSAVTHVVVPKNSGRLQGILKVVSSKRRIPRIVTPSWIEDCWKEGTRLDEERYAAQ